MTISQIEAKSLVSYDPLTGVFLWNKPRPGCTTGALAGGVTSYGYWKIHINGKNYLGHRLAWIIMTGSFPETDIDHANGEKLDNRFSNLRLATPSQNQANKMMRKDNTSGVKGVTWDKSRGKWLASIHVQRKRIQIGRFAELSAAADAYEAAAILHFAEFARPERSTQNVDIF